MTSAFEHVDCHSERYRQGLKLFLERSNEEQCTRDFIHNTLPDILARIGNGKSQLNVIGVGSGDGIMDLEMLSQLCLMHPGVLVDNEVVEPDSQRLQEYREMVAQKPNLEHIKFTFNQMTASEFEEQRRQKNITKKADFIHMLQMMYFITDPEATISFFQSLLDKNGKLLIILTSDESGRGNIVKTFGSQIFPTKSTTATDIRKLLDARGVPYQWHELLAHLDITECFIEGDEAGELLLDFLTKVQDFKKTVSPELREGVMKLLQKCSVEKECKVLLSHHCGIIILDALN